ncbi:colicin V production protein [Ligilactobacillus salitolerans]|uniref:Colicin V production protein n=1 Tax=Ligilactobacillus salitolerans TaxID=1808352 RepID=A0A401IQ00_9LACO|nr:CvpA family protein [Ligilactobacillus salitolerans]GBG93617.1 colicin V production protein [Ligilactobacillus salitolerans]
MLFSIVIILLLIFGAVQGYRTGLLVQISGIASLILAFIFAMFYSQSVTQWINAMLVKFLKQDLSVGQNYGLYIVVFICLLLFTSGVFQSIGRMLAGLTKLPLIGLGNSLLGIIAGVAIQGLVVFICLNLMLATQSSWVRQQYHQSELAQRIVNVKTS